MVAQATVAEAAAAAGLSKLGFALRSLEDRGEVTLNAGLPLYPASMIKTPLAAAVLALVDQGVLGLDDLVAVEAGNLTANDLASPLVLGYRARISELIELMIARSDNVATNILIDVAGRDRATELLQRWGFGQTAIRRKLSGADPLIDDPAATGRNTHPAEEAATLFEQLAGGRLPHSAVLLGALERQRWNTKLSRGLDPGDRFAHKTGDTSEVSHDGGILTTAHGRRYVIVAYTGMPTSDEVDARFAAFMRALRPHLG